MSPEVRGIIYENVRKHQDVWSIVEMIDEHDLTLSSGGLNLDDLFHCRIVKIA